MYKFTLTHILPLLNANIDFNKTCVPLERCNHTGVTFKYHIEISYM